MNKVEWKLLEPFKIGFVTLKNRIVMPAMASRLCTTDGAVTQKSIDYYGERAKGGAGLIILETHYIDDKAARSDWVQMGIYSNRLLNGMNQLAEEIHSHGAAVIVQLAHAGRQRQDKASKEQPVAPSAIPLAGGEMPREMTLSEIEEIENAYAEAALRAKMAGYDGVEVHGAHGSLVEQFLSSYSNQRNDKYGGSLENRARFPLEVTKKIRDKVGDNFIVGYRMSAEEYVTEGLTIAATSQFAKMLDSARVLDYINVSCGLFAPGSAHHTIPPAYLPKAHSIDLAQAIKKVVTMPVINAGAHDIYTAEEALQQGKADLIGFGRTLIADPELPQKLIEGRIEDIRPCIRGNEGCFSGAVLGRPQRCEVNPACGREADLKITPAQQKKMAVVIGGGIAGLEAARIAALRGHEVTILERSEKPGGHLVEASVPEFKEKTRQLLDWSIGQVRKAGIKIKLSTEATPRLIKELKPEVLVIATGSEYIIPPVPGCDKGCVTTAEDVLLGKKPFGEKIVVVGAGLVGCETALHLAETSGKQVTIVEMLDEALPDLEPFSKMALAERLDKAGVKIHLGWRLEEITDSGVICTDKTGQNQELEADTVVLATGLGARKRAAEEFRNLAPEVYIIGDCVQARKIYHCFEDAWRVALKI